MAKQNKNSSTTTNKAVSNDKRFIGKAGSLNQTSWTNYLTLWNIWKFVLGKLWKIVTMLISNATINSNIFFNGIHLLLSVKIEFNDRTWWRIFEYDWILIWFRRKGLTEQNSLTKVNAQQANSDYAKRLIEMDYQWKESTLYSEERVQNYK